MKRKIMKPLVFLLLLAVVFPAMGFAVTPAELTIEHGKQYGLLMGAEEGALAGREDASLGLTSSAKRNMPSDEDLIMRFQLNKDVIMYQIMFLSNYKEAYELAYLEAYRSYRIEEITKPYELGYDHGLEAGRVQGVVSAMTDYALDRSNDYQRAYKSYLADSSLEERFFLSLQVPYYRTRFVSGFVTGFRETYIETFQRAYLDAEIKNANSKTVSILADTLYFDEEYTHFESGTPVTEIRTPLMLEFPEGAVYEPTSFKAFRVNNSFGVSKGSLVPVTFKYVVTVSNSKGYAVLERPIELGFEYYGSEYAGIYQWYNGKWVYLNSTISNGQIRTTIDAGQYTGGEYAIFVDPSAKDIPQQHLSWARDEIYTMMRRGIVKNAKDYQPEAFLTRAALAEMIYAQLKSQYGMGVAGAFTDSSSFGASQTAIQFAVGNRFMS